MANSFKYKDTNFAIGDTINMVYKVKEGDKIRQQSFKGILIKVRGKDDQSRMMTVRKMSRIGVGIERIVPLASPFIADIKLVKKSNYRKAKLYFIRDLSEQQVRSKLYQSK